MGQRESNEGIWRQIREAYPEIIEGILGIGQIVITLMQVFIQSLGMVVILVMLALVEIMGIESGLWFLNHPDAAKLSAIALVAYNMLIDTMIVNIEHDNKYNPKRDRVASLRIMIQNGKYYLGIGDDWKAREKSPAHSFYIQRRLITFGVFIVALSGRIQPLIASVSDVPLSESFGSFFAQATLQDAWIWVSGVMLTMISLLGVQRLTHYMAKQVIVIKDDMKKKATNKKKRDTRRRNKARRSHDVSRLIDPTDATSNDRRMTDATRGEQRLSLPDALDVLRRNIDIIKPGKSAPTICDELLIDQTSLRTVQRALRKMRKNNEID